MYKYYKLDPYPGIEEKLLQLPKPEKWTRQTQYASVIDRVDDKIIERVFAFRYKNKKEFEYKEVIRRPEDNDKILVKDMDFINMAGYRCLWPDTKKSWYSYYPCDEKWHESSIKHFNVNRFHLFTAEDLIKLDPTLKYCNYKSGDVIAYINTYRRYPDLEFLSKLDIEFLAYSKMFLNKLKKDNKFRKFVIKNIDFIKRDRSNYNLLRDAYRDNNSLEDQKLIKNINYNLKRYNIKEYFKNSELRLKNYLKKQNKTIVYYCDYFSMAMDYINIEELTNDTKNLFPNNLEERHDHFVELHNQKEIAEKQEEDKKLLEIVNRYLPIEYQNNNYAIILAKQYRDLVQEGKALIHCVGGTNYLSKMLEEKSLILFVRKVNEIDKPLATVEFSFKDLKILQCRASNNRTPEDEVLSFTNEWLKMVESIQDKLKREIKKTKKLKKAA